MNNGIKRLLKFFIVVLSIVLTFAILIFGSMLNLRNNYNRIVNDYMETEEQVAALSDGIYHIQTIALVQLSSSDDDYIHKLEAEYDELNQKNLELFEILNSELKSEDEQNELHNLYSEYLECLDKGQTIEQIKRDDAGKAQKYYITYFLEANLSDMNASLDNLNELIKQKIDAGKREVNIATKATIITIGFITIILAFTVFQCIYKFTNSAKTISKDIETEFQKHREQIISMQSKTINDLAELVESRDGDTGTHIKNTAWYVGTIAMYLAENSVYRDELDNETISLMTQYAPLHDVGKILVSDTILLKNGKLTEDEFDKIKCHAARGGEIIERILEGIETPEHVAVARDIATYHHEKWDGTGYPFGLNGTNIPLCARIMAVADVFDALISPRCYKSAFSIDRAYEIINEGSGTHFDPIIVDAFNTLRPQVEKYLEVSKLLA